MELPHAELALKEYETLQAEKRDRMQARLHIWSVVIGLIGAFGLASLQQQRAERLGLKSGKNRTIGEF